LEFDKEATDKLLSYHYPGNVRELQYAIERAVIMSDGTVLKERDILFSPLESAMPEEKEAVHTNLGDVEKNTILKVIEKHGGNISKAAKELGITRTALYRRLNKYDI
jgi:transcriptional regulator of acetoin/glycerol metabolism